MPRHSPFPAAAAAQKEAEAVTQLKTDYIELGRLRAQRDTMERGSTERAALSQEIKSRSGKLNRQGQKLGVDLTQMKGFEDAARAEEDAVIAARKHREEYDKLIAKIKERNKEQEKLAGVDKDSEFAKGVKSRVDNLNSEIDRIEKIIKLTKEEQAEVDKLNAKRDGVVSDKQNKKQDQADAKAFKEALKQAKKDNNIDIANSRLNSGRKALTDLWVLDDNIDPDSIPEISALRTELTALRIEYDSVNQAMQRGDDISNEEIDIKASNVNPSPLKRRKRLVIIKWAT